MNGKLSIVKIIPQNFFSGQLGALHHIPVMRPDGHPIGAIDGSMKGPTAARDYMAMLTTPNYF